MAIASASVTEGDGHRSEASTTAVLPDTMTGATLDTRPSSGDGSAAMIPTTPVGSGVEILKNGPDTGLRFPITWANLSAHPAYQTSRSTARATSRRALAAPAPGEFYGSAEGLGPVLDHLGDPVEDLAPVVAGAGRPSRLGPPRRPDRHPQVLAGAGGHPGDHLALVVESRERPARLGAREVPVDVQLVGLADREPAHDPPPRRAPGRSWRVPGRSRRVLIRWKNAKNAADGPGVPRQGPPPPPPPWSGA